jgi:O-antigen/teichoic acid export membrane protein
MQINKITTKLLFSSFSKLFASVGLIFFSFIVINLMDKETLGMLTAAISLITFLSIFSKFGLNHATLRLVSIFYEKNDKEKIKKLIIYAAIISGIISSAISFLIIFFEKQIAIEIYNNEEFKGVLKIIAISLPIFTFIQIQKSLLRSLKLPELSNFSDLGFILFICCLIMLFFDIVEVNLSIYRISLFFLLSCLLIFSVNNFILFYFIILNLKTSAKNKAIDLKKKLTRTLPDYFVIDFINYSLVWGSIFICTFYYEPITIGNFSSTYWLAFSLLFFPLVLNSIYAPSYAINSEKNEKKKLKKIFYQNRNISIITTLPFFLIIFIFPEFVLNKVFEIYSIEYVLILRILLVNSMLRVIFGPQVLFLNMSDKQKKVKSISIICAIFQIILIFISVNNFNLTVLSVSFLISNLVKHILLKIELQNYFIR